MLIRKTFMATLAATSLFMAGLNSAPALAADPTCTITITQSGSQVDGTNNADVICINADNVTVNALGSNDTIVDNGNNNTIYMGDGNDVFVPGTGTGSTIDAGAGDDTVTGTPGTDTITGGEGDDTLIGGAGDDTISGGNGNDRLEGDAGADTISGDAGTDNLDGGDGTDTLNGGAGDDTLIGGAANDNLNGGDGADNLEGDAGNDNIFGEAGTDTLQGNAGDDLLAGGADIDSLNGGAGLNTCDYNSGESLTQTCKYDDAPPVVSALVFDKLQIDVGSSSQQVNFSFNASDATGVSSVDVQCFEPKSSQFFSAHVDIRQSGFNAYSTLNGASISSVDSIEGNAQNFTAGFHVTFPTGSKPGVYSCQTFAVDQLTNRDPSYLTTNAAITVVRSGSGFDDAPPVVSALVFDKLQIDVGSSSQQVNFSFNASDATGVSSVDVQCFEPKSSQFFSAHVDIRQSGFNAYSTLNGASISSVDSIEGNAQNFTAGFHVTFPTGSKPGVYSCQTFAVDQLTNRDPSYLTTNASVTLSRTPAGQPSAPASLGFQPNGFAAGTLSWSAPSNLGNPSLTGYVVQYSSDGSTWQDLKNGATSATSLPVSNLKADTDYWFRVRGENGGTVGQDTTFMNLSWSSIKIHTQAQTVAAAPTALKITNVDVGSAALSWSAPSTDGGSAITDFKVETSRDGGTTWVEVKKQAPSTSLSLGLTGLAPGTAYKVRVSAINSVGASDFLTGDFKTTGSVPGKVLNVTASNVASSTLTLNWNLPATNGGVAISDYKLEVSGNNGATWTTITHDPLLVRSFNVNTLTKNKAYLFRVSAINAIGTGAASDVLKVTTLAGVPAAPTALTTPSITTIGASLGWTAPTDNGGANITDYKVEISRDGNTWTTVPRTASTSRSQNITGLAPGTTYQVKVSALNTAGFSQALTGSFKTVATTPSAISNLAASKITGTGLSLTWNLPATNGGSDLTDYSVLVSSNGTSFTAISHTASNLLAFAVTNLSAGTKYWFKVAAVNAKGLSPYSDPITVVTVGNAPAAPTSLTVTNVAGSQIKLGWKAATVTGGSPVRDYKIEYSSDNGKTWLTVSKTASTSTTFTTTNLKAATTYLFRISALNDVGYSTPSANLKVVTK
jgi:hypothetical protein